MSLLRLKGERIWVGLTEGDHFVGRLKLAGLWAGRTKRVGWWIRFVDCVDHKLDFVVGLE